MTTDCLLNFVFLPALTCGNSKIVLKVKIILGSQLVRTGKKLRNQQKNVGQVLVLLK